MAGQKTAADLTAETFRLFESLERSLHSLADMAKKEAQAEHDYRKGKSAAWTEVRVKDGMTAADKEAMVNAITAELRRDRDIAQGMAQTARYAIQSRKQQLSALQSLMKVSEAEAQIVNHGQVPA